MDKEESTPTDSNSQDFEFIIGPAGDSVRKKQALTDEQKCFLFDKYTKNSRSNPFVTSLANSLEEKSAKVI